MDGIVSRAPIYILLFVLLVALGAYLLAPVFEVTTGAAGLLLRADPAGDTPAWAKVAPEQMAEAKKHGVPVAFENDLGMRFVLIPAGTFLMGSPEDEEGRGDDEAQHEVTITKPYYMQITEVTNGQYRRFAPEHVCAERGEYDLERSTHPVCGVTWVQAVAFAKWAGGRLPTEAEWERAARGGLDGKEWPWGDEWNPERVNCLGDADGYEQSSPVGSFPPNRYGVYDMAGNVEEWCGDPWRPSPPRGTDLGFSVRLRGDMTEMTPEEAARWDRMEAEEAKLPHRAVRGGSWFGPNVGCSRRFGLAEIRRKIGLGLRLVSPLPEPTGGK